MPGASVQGNISPMARLCVVAMLIITSVLIGAVPGALAASYARTDETIVDPILFTAAFGSTVHSYSGPDLHPGANLANAKLGDAELAFASLESANLKGANLIGANLSGADLSV